MTRWTSYCFAVHPHLRHWRLLFWSWRATSPLIFRYSYMKLLTNYWLLPSVDHNQKLRAVNQVFVGQLLVTCSWPTSHYHRYFFGWEPLKGNAVACGSCLESNAFGTSACRWSSHYLNYTWRRYTCPAVFGPPPYGLTTLRIPGTFDDQATWSTCAWVLPGYETPSMMQRIRRIYLLARQIEFLQLRASVLV